MENRIIYFVKFNAIFSYDLLLEYIEEAIESKFKDDTLTLNEIY